MFNKELLEKIKSVTKQIFGTENFATEKLKDSEVEVKYSELIVGAQVTQSSPDGDTPVDDGTHILDSGISFTTVDGKITEVIEAPEEVEEVKEELAEEEKVEETKEEEVKEELATEDNSELLEKIASLEAEIASIKEALSQPKEKEVDEAFTKLENDVKAIAEVLNLLAKTPAEFSKVDNRIESIDSKNEKLKALADIISLKK
ncbi:MAG: hypothetical protein EOO44_19315 [Flavobacterium sp.]|nr:MAG: hypothetical protein EOO44_19315 [Flavobacterium sp.]